MILVDVWVCVYGSVLSVFGYELGCGMRVIELFTPVKNKRMASKLRLELRLLDVVRVRVSTR